MVITWLVLSIYRNRICNSCRYRLMSASKAGGGMDFDLSERSEAVAAEAAGFFRRGSAAAPPRLARSRRRQRRNAALHGATCRQKARAAGLWNLGLPELAADEPGTRLSNLEYAPLAEIMGRLFWAPEVFNCQAPDVPNMIALQNCATPEQKARWLQPLLEAKNPLGLRHDRAGCRLIRRHQHRDHGWSATAAITSSTAANGSSPAPRIRNAAS